jgi:flagellar hook assembly protein FlgD
MTMLGTSGSLLAFIYIHNEGEATGTLYRAQGSIENVLNQDETLPVQPELTVYPNPFRQSMTIQVSSAKQTSADISLYNIKGQKVAVIGKNMLLAKGVSTLEWDGTDTQGTEVGTGLYFLKSKIAGRTKLVKILKLN